MPKFAVDTVTLGAGRVWHAPECVAKQFGCNYPFDNGFAIDVDKRGGWCITCYAFRILKVVVIMRAVTSDGGCERKDLPGPAGTSHTLLVVIALGWHVTHHRGLQ